LLGRRGKAIIEQEKEQALAGRKVFFGKTVRSATRASNRKAFSSTFSLNWAKQADVPSDSGNPAHFTLPMSFADWELFRKKPSLQRVRSTHRSDRWPT